ncbi:MAG: septum formation protein Maf [Spirochaetes bacterium GWF1_31_7]|nr:MAG: septum formation protein Maf [Spirochaetes bacterium GWE1_32_154]OHD46488.1 MAG: septum formation protein Maf [Spirochaetes bacterium GWE2_31_10]OHD50843.1 MAG: septum formation protein Maf [Spirochaetes bacterium GWF1_31_7]HBD93390.1 septum formation protein Maf [Spirochaetia bacterium]HBI37073.1 septum formation protein Maf [Spirochaetia bacterium]
MVQKKTIVLASGSPRRQELLKSVGIDFIKRDHGYIEENHPTRSPGIFVQELSCEKALHADLSDLDSNVLVLGVDTIVYYNKKILGKPMNADDALKNIMSLSGKWHSVFTGITIINKLENSIYSDYCETKVKFSKLDNDFIKYYIENKFYEGYAGGYAIQGIFSLVVEKIRGSYSNVVGLPMETLYKLLNKTGYIIFR